MSVRELVDSLSSATLAIVLAVMVWLVAAERDPALQMETQRLTDVPLQFAGLPSGHAYYDPSARSIDVEVRGMSAGLAEMSVDDIRARVALGVPDDGAGLVERSVQLSCTDCRRRGVRVLAHEPVSVTVGVGRKVTQTRPVVVVRTGEPAALYSIVRSVADPPQVLLAAAEPLLARVQRVVAAVDVSDLQDDRTYGEVPVRALLPSGTAVPSDQLSVRPAQVEVRIAVRRTGGLIAQVRAAQPVGEPEQGYRHTGRLTVEPSEVRLEGPEVLLEQIEEEQDGVVATRPIDISGATDDVRRLVGLVLPDGVTAVDAPVLVTAEIEATPTTRTFEDVPVVLRGLPEGLAVESFSPERVSVTVSGPRREIEALSAESIVATVDLSGQEAGTRRLLVTVDAPDGIEVPGTQPETVEVVLRGVRATPSATPTPEGPR